MNNDTGYTIYCSRCGAEMNSNSRYCMKCGNLNYDHQANQNMKSFIPKNEKTSYQVGAGKFINSSSPSSSNQVRMSVATRTGNKKLCFFLNYFLYLGLIILSFFFTVQGNYDLDFIMKSSFSTFAILLSLVAFYLYSLEQVFMKCNHAWWEALIPFYNFFVLSDIIFHKKILGILSFIPGVNIVFSFILFYKLGASFAYNGILVALLPIIYVPLMGLGSHVFNGYMFVSGDAQKEAEKDYKIRKIFFITVLFFFIVGVGLRTMNFMTNGGGENITVDGLYFTYTSKSLISKVSNKTKKNDVTCRYEPYSESSGIYYFPFNDVQDSVFLLFYDFREPIQGYVKVDNTSGTSVYSISLTDGTFGFPEMIDQEVGISSLQKYNQSMSMITREVNTCKFAN